MKCTGYLTELEIEDINEFDYSLDDAIVTDERIALDWSEEGEVFHALLHSDDGVYYEGLYGSPQANPSWNMSAVRYDAADGDILLLLEWKQSDNGYGGSTLVRLESAN